MLSKYLRYIEQIEGFDVENIKIQNLSNGLNNYNYLVTNQETGEKVLFKLFGQRTSVNYNLLENLSKIGFSGKILIKFAEGYIQEWIEGNSLTHNMINSNVLKNIANKLRNFHDKMSLNHNDLNFKNIIVDNNLNIHFIDYEFSGNKNVLYDIANFFCEWIYQYKNPGWYKYDLSLFPSNRQIYLFCKTYMRTDDENSIIQFISNIFNQIQYCHKFWINWSSSFKKSEYKLYKYFRMELLKVDFKNLLKNRVIYCDGVFDMLHIGHISFFNKIRNLGCKKLIVGVISDKNAKSYKRKPIIELSMRVKLLESIGIVDKVIEDCPFNSITQEFMDNHGIDLVVYGGDPKLKDPLGRWFNHYKVPYNEDKLQLLEYSPCISTSEIINKCKKQ